VLRPECKQSFITGRRLSGGDFSAFRFLHLRRDSGGQSKGHRWMQRDIARDVPRLPSPVYNPSPANCSASSSFLTRARNLGHPERKLERSVAMLRQPRKWRREIQRSVSHQPLLVAVLVPLPPNTLTRNKWSFSPLICIWLLPHHHLM